MRPDDSRWRLAGGSLVITSQNGDLQGNVNTAKNLALQDVNGDWTAESKLVFSRPLANNNEQGGIVAYANDNNYVKLAWEMGSSTAAINKLRVVVIREQNGTATTLQVQGSDAQRIVGADGAIWLRLTKTGSTYKAYYSNNGSVYRFMGSTTLNVEPAQAGLVAFNRGGNSTDLDVAFDYFRIESQGDPVPFAVAADGTVGATVPATLSLTLGRAGQLRRVHRRASTATTAASTTASVISTAGDAALAVSDPSPANTGRLVNGAFALAQPVQAQASSAAGTGVGVRAGRRLGEPDDAADLRRPGEQRRGDDRPQADDRPHGGAAHGQLRQDADVHLVHDDPIAPVIGVWPSPSASCEPSA